MDNSMLNSNHNKYTTDIMENETQFDFNMNQESFLGINLIFKRFEDQFY